MSYLKDREIWLSNVPTGNPPAGYFWKFIQNGKVVVRDSSGNNQMMIATSGSQAITGSLTVTEGITGTVSSASYVEYSGVANKPTLVSGSSQITYSGLTGIPSGIVSGSSQVTFLGLSSIPSGIVSGSGQVDQFGYATTGSNGFNGSQSITGSLTVTGQVIAQTLNVQQVTSSIVYSSGSNIFGNNSGNTHSFTGSLGVTGSLVVNGTSAVIGSGSINYVPKFTGASIIGNSVVYDNGNQIGIGQTTLFSKFSIADSLSATSVGSNYNPGILNIQNTNTTNGNISLIGFQDASAFINLAAIGSINEVHSSSPNNVKGSLGFYTKNNGTSYITEKMRLDASGNLGIGTITPASRLNVAGAKTNSAVLSNSANQLAVTDTTATAAGVGGRISFLGSYTATPDYITFGAVEVLKDNANNYGSAGWNNASMRFIVGNNDNDANAGRMLERMRITSGGNVGIGTTNISTEANLYLGAQGAVEGGQMVLQKGTSCQCATHLDNYNNLFRVMSGSDTTSTTVNMSINHTNGAATFGSTLTATTITGTNGVNTVSTVSSIPFTSWTTLVTIDSNTTGMYLVVIGLTGGGGALTDWTATGIVYTNGSTAAWLTGPTNASLVQLRISGLAIQVYQNGTNPSISLSYKLLKIS